MLAAHHLYTARLFDASALVPSKLNLTAVSSQRSLLFVAIGKRVSVYAISHHAQPPVFKQRLDYAQPIQGDEINAISLGRQTGSETVVAVFDSGRTICWKLDAGFPVLWDRPGRVSTWGCAVHQETDAVATSANSHVITVLRSPRMGSGSSSSHATAELGFHADEFELAGHADNIPCVSFSVSGRYLASASIDFSIRVWSMSTKQMLFIFRYSQWCWAVAFVYPFYFMPIVEPSESGPKSTESAHEQQMLPGLGDAFFSGWSEDIELVEEARELEQQQQQEEEEEESRSSDESMSQTSSQLQTEYFEVSAEHIDQDAEAAPLRIIDHSEDIANGLATTETPPASDPATDTDHSGDPQDPLDSIYVKQPEALEPEDGSSRLGRPLLLCSTRKDVLLLDPSSTSNAEVVVDRIEYAVCRTRRPSLIDVMVFDRITVLEWIPDMAIVIAGSYSGNIAVIRLETFIADDSGPKYRMRLLFHLPETPVNRQLYGVSVYRHPIDAEKFRAVTLYIAFLDGRLMAYELYYP
ncbi:hypothetical protein LPJ64_002313 [Coemansia asiatica]|uniref:WD40 repeat-like protein n=1 Tax=Coemansia asiatica TaxID=1052880 RepID=A0A9W7XMB3_9FUNG|nr:hypothetical protein LPJ64_002313 [Coemansia asiatica]